MTPQTTSPPSSSSPLAARATADALRLRLGGGGGITPHLAIILGSGLGGVTNAVHGAVRVPYAEVPGFTTVHVPGHKGEVVVGTLEGVPVVIFAGRFHLYEGHSAAMSGFPVRVAHALGARTLFVSNAAGGINPNFTPGDLMLITDHINLMGTSPLVGGAHAGDIRFPDMSEPYDAELRATLRTVAARVGIPLQEGVYAALLGPTYETRAEVKMLSTLGADAVGMSTVPEVIVARALSMRVAGVSCITNMACGIQTTTLDHADVLQTTARVAHAFEFLVCIFVTTL